MKISELAEALDLKLFTDGGFEDREVTGCYIGDLLSWVMGRAKPGDVWITIMSNINIAAVASLADVACVILAEGVVPDGGITEKANAQDIVIFGSGKTSYELAAAIAKEVL